MDVVHHSATMFDIDEVSIGVLRITGDVVLNSLQRFVCEFSFIVWTRTNLHVTMLAIE